MTQRLTVAILVAALGAALAAQQPAAPQARADAGRSASGHLPRRGELRRGRCVRHRRARERRSPTSRRTTSRSSRTASRRRSRPSRWSTFRSSAPSGRCSRASRSSPTCRPTNISRAASICSSSTTSTPTSPERRASRPRRADSSSRTSAPTISPRSSTPDGRDASQDFTNNPRLLIAGDRQVQRTQAALGDDPAHRERARQSRDRPARARRRHRPDGSRVPRAVGDEQHPQARRVHGRRARPPQGDAADRRRHRLQHLRSDRRAGIDRLVGAAGYAGCHRLGHARQRRASTRSIRAACTVGDEDLITQSSTVGDANVQSLQSELRLSQDSLRVLATSTGGFAAVNRNDLNGAFDRIVAENSSYYMFGYYSTNERRDGRFRKIEVRVKRPGLRVRSRNGYFEARGRASEYDALDDTVSPALAEAIGSPLPVNGVPIKVFAAPFKGTAPECRRRVRRRSGRQQLRVRREGRHLQRDARARQYSDRREGQDVSRRASARESQSEARYAARARRAAASALVNQVSLPPGRYQMRIAAASTRRKARAACSTTSRFPTSRRRSS